MEGESVKLIVIFAHVCCCDAMLDNEKEILDRISEGDEKAFLELFRYYFPRVKTLIGSIVTEMPAVEDLTQDIFVKIWLMRASLPDIRSFGAYLYRMSRNATLSFCKSRGVTVPFPEELDIEVPSVYEDYVRYETESRIFRGVEDLPSKRRRIFLMSREEGLSNAEIAERLNISPKTVENQITLALRQLRNIVSIMALFI